MIRTCKAIYIQHNVVMQGIKLRHHAKHSALVFFGCLVIVTALLLIANVPTKLSAQSTLQVTAKVNAPLPTSPALITSPSDQQHFNTSAITVSGTCGDGVYIALYRHNQPSGTAACLGGIFSLQTSLFTGPNLLTAKVFNSTDNEGPAGNIVTVFYDPPLPDPFPPVDASLGLQVSAVDGVAFVPGRLFKTSPFPVIQGYAPPSSKVTITYAPSGYTCTVVADGRGAWTCKLNRGLPAGNQQVTVSSISPQGVPARLAPFSIVIASDISPNIAGVKDELYIIYSPEPYRMYTPGEQWRGTLAIYGGTSPYSVRIEWGDSLSSFYEPASSTPFLIDHSYQHAGHYRPMIYAVDAVQNKASLQLFIPVVGKEKDIRPTKTEIIPIVTVSLITILLFAISVAELAIAAKTLHLKRLSRRK